MPVKSSKKKSEKRAVDGKDSFAAYQQMFLIRTAEERLAAYYLANKVMSFVHFYTGQEAVAVGVARSLKTRDKMLGNHRSHGHYLAKGGDLRAMVRELLGKEGGSSRGKGGSMHMIDSAVGFVGSTPILGSVVPLSTGVAFAQKYRKEKNVTVCFYGDGASEEGVVYESYNLAGLFKLPVLFVIENNLFSVNSSLDERRSPGYDIGTIVKGFGVRYTQADGNDYQDVRQKSAELVEYIRSGAGPAVLECVTYRHRAHSAPIFDESCRKEDTLEARASQDSLARLRQEVLGSKITEKKIMQTERAIEKQVDDTIAAAAKAGYPNPKTVTTDLYV